VAQHIKSLHIIIIIINPAGEASPQPCGAGWMGVVWRYGGGRSKRS